MDFLTTARLLMDLQAKHPGMHFRVLDRPSGAVVVIDLPVAEDVPAMFDQGRQMFAPID